MPRLPSLLVLVETDAAGSKSDHEQEAANDRYGLKEVVLEEVVHGLARVDRPEGIGHKVEHGEEQTERERAQLGLEADGDQYDEERADHVEYDVHEREVDANEREEHHND